MKKIVFILLTSFFYSSHAQTDYTFVYNSDSIIRKGVELYEDEKYSEAIKLFEKVSPVDPKFLNAQYEKALALSAYEKNDELKKFFEDLHNKKSMAELPTLYTIYGSFLSNQKEYDKAEEIFNEGLKYLPNSSNFLYNFAVLYYKKSEQQKCLDILKKIITNDPNHNPSHYLLGAIALENGKIVEGTLALMSYLVLSPDGQFAEKAIQILNSKYGENFLEKNKLIFSKTGDNFEDIEVVLRNQLALKSAFKVKSNIDDVIIRQVQAIAEYSVEHKSGDGFFETIYMPWIKDMTQKGQFEGYSYYILQSFEDKIGKKLTSKKKILSDFHENYILKDLWNSFGKRKLDHFGSQQEVIVFIKDGTPFLIGQEINDKSEGKFKYLNSNGNLAGELYFNNNELDGIQKYYDEKGNLEEVKHFKNGKLDGERITYYSNGLIGIIENYKDDKLDGKVISYYTNGGKQCEFNYLEGELDGNLKCFYTNGSLKTEKNYLKGKLNGLCSTYNEVGDLIEKFNCINDLIDGKYIEYYDGKTIESEANYVEGKIKDSYKSFYKNGSLEKENTYLDGKLIKYVNYFANGKKSSESIYNDKEEIESYSYYDTNDNKYFEEKYNSNKLKSGLQFSKDNKNPIEISLSSKQFIMKDFEQNQLAVGKFEKENKVGEWNHYYSSGRKKLQEFYSKGIQTGLSYNYEGTGLIYEIVNYSNDTINGLYEVYDNGILDRTFSYENGIQTGPIKTFYKNGKLKSEGFRINGNTNYELLSYRQDGTISRKEKYLENELNSLKTYNLKGELENNFDYLKKTGKFNFNYYNGTTTIINELINGELNGKAIEKDKLNYPITETNFINGVRHNNYKDYSPLGTLYRESNYYNGLLNGIDVVYDIVGNLRYTSENILGESNGKQIRYYHNKNKYLEFNMVNGSIEGNYTYYNQKGEPVLIINYLNDKISHYFKKNKMGELNEKVNINNETAEITSTYPNGKTAIYINYNKGNLEGKYTIFNEYGNIEYEANYTNNQLNGNRIEYYSNGKIYKKEYFINGNFEGTQEYYKEDGTIWLKAEYKNDELHGDLLIYNGGKLVLTKKYDSDELVEIIK